MQFSILCISLYILLNNLAFKARSNDFILMEKTDSGGEYINNLLVSMLSHISNKGFMAIKYCEALSKECPAGLLDELKRGGLNNYEAERFVLSIARHIIPSIKEACKEHGIEGSRPFVEALYCHKEDIAWRINRKIGAGHRHHLEKIASDACYFKHIFQL